MPTGQHFSSRQWLYSSKLLLQSASLPCLLSRCDLGLNCDKHSPPSCPFSLAAGSESHSLSLSAAVLGPQACSRTAGILHSQPSLTLRHAILERAGHPALMIAEKSLLCVELAPCLSLYENQGGQFSICWLLAWDGLGLNKWMLTLDFESGADRDKRECGSRWHSTQLLLLRRQLSPLGFLPS